MGEKKLNNAPPKKEKNGIKSTYTEKFVLVSAVTVSQFEHILP